MSANGNKFIGRCNQMAEVTVNKSKKRSRNPIARYFADFGLKQVCDITMIVGAILLIVGLSISVASVKAAKVVLLIGLIVYIIAAGLAIFSAVRVLVNKEINHRAPEYKRAIVNVSIMSLIFALAVFALVWLIVA